MCIPYLKPHKTLRYITLDYVRFVFIWRPRGSDSTQRVRESPYRNHQDAQHSKRLHHTGLGRKDTEANGPLWGLYSEEERDSKTDEALRPHPNTCLILALIRSLQEVREAHPYSAFFIKFLFGRKKKRPALQRTSSPLDLFHNYSK